LTGFERFDNTLESMRNFVSLNEKEIMDNYTLLEQIFKIPKYDLNIIINSIYFSNFGTSLLDIFSKLPIDEYRSHKEFLKKFYLELAKLIFATKIEDGSFLNLIKILDTVISQFLCFKNISTKEKIINSVILHLANYLLQNLEEILDLIMSFDHKLLLEITKFPVNLYKIYNFYRDPNNPNKKVEQALHRYINFLFENLRNLVDAENFTVINKTITEYKNLDNFHNPQLFSTEIIELLSKFLELNDNLEKTSGNWFDVNLKLISKNIENIDYNETIDLVLNLLPETRNISNPSDRIYTLFNLFFRLILVNIDYSNFFEKESLILCLFKQDWFVLLIKASPLEERESRFRHDFFICLIEALYHAKIYILKNGDLKKLINWIKICLDIIDVCFKIIEWEDEGESYKMYFLVLEETCLFFDDAFFGFIYGQESDFVNMKIRLEQVLVEIGKRFSNKVWGHLSFANENSKYRSLLLLSQFLTIDNVSAINTILEVIFLRMNEIQFDKKNEKFLEQILKSCLFLAIRVNISTREKIIQNLADYVEKIKLRYDSDASASIINNIRSFSENILNYLLDHKSDPQIILDSKIVDKLNNEFFLIIPKDVETNMIQKNFNYNNLYLLNICQNSNTVLESSLNENSSIYLDYFKKLYYYPMLEFNNDFCHFSIDNEICYKFSDWKLVTGISDPVHIYYMYKINIETREIELFVKCFNSTSCVLNNVLIQIYLSKNLILSRGEGSSTNSGQTNFNNSNFNPTSKEFNFELLSPFSTSEFSVKFYSKIFEKNNISIDCTFDMVTDYAQNFTLTTESFHIPLIDFCIQDNFSLYETKKFDIFYQTLEYTFTIKCFAQMTPEELLKNISDRFVMIEYKSKSYSIDKTRVIMDQLKEIHYKDFMSRQSIMPESGQGENFMASQNLFEENQRYNFKIKLSSYSVYNFWVYIVIIGDYNFQNNKSILNIEVKSNDLTALNIISREKYVFFNELLNKQIKFY
jgi:hypothetical protein